LILELVKAEALPRRVDDSPTRCTALTLVPEGRPNGLGDGSA